MNTNEGPKAWYYLHVNGQLIVKPYADAIVDIRESDLAVMGWPILPERRENAWRILIEAGALGALPEQIEGLAERWGCDNRDAVELGARYGIQFSTRDGLVEARPRAKDVVGTGHTPLWAMVDLCKKLNYVPSKLGWGATFLELVKTAHE